MLYFTVNQMIVTAFGDSFCLPDLDPIGGLITGALEPILFDKGLQQEKRVMIYGHPVIGD